ncbi:MAG: bifunctional phosphoribosylaminoimidazolecarboxamide formyltransferase/IMP cyclohydrolase [Chloroflexi bacterium]|nr:bifunctional phosphoribosylaminoimidazolecarboxamide formyltransferase/IMP cyclohydrolase [Chloroflexota bacterium]
MCVSGRGSNLRALRSAERRGALGGPIVLVLADRPCPALDFARDEGIPVALVEPGADLDRAAWDAAVAGALLQAAPAWIVLAGFMRWLGKATLAAFPDRILNLHPSLLPAFPGIDAIADALAGGVRVTGVTVHLVDASRDGGPIVAQQALPILPGEDEASLAARIHAVEHTVLPRVVALALGGALTVRDGRVMLDPQRAGGIGATRRALLSVSDKDGLVELARGLVVEGFELVSTGGTATALRDAGLEVTDVAAITGFPEMLDGRVKTLHPRIHAGVLADQASADHRGQLAELWIEPFELVVVNLYPFASTARRPGVELDELIEQIDIGGPTLVRAAAKNHVSVGIITAASQYQAVLGELRRDGRLSERTRRSLAVEAFQLTAGYDAQVAESLVRHDVPTAEPVAFPISRTVLLARTLELRYGENPHQRAALYRVPDQPEGSGPFAAGASLLQGKPLSYNNILDAAAAAELARQLKGAACVIVKHTNPCGAAEAATLMEAWQRALAGDPLSAFGGVVAVTRPVDVALAEQLSSKFLEVLLAPSLEVDVEGVLAKRPDMRVLLDPWLGTPPLPSIELRSAGGGVLAMETDSAPDDPATWQVVTRRGPTDAELRDLDLAWRVARHVKSNAIVLVRDGAVVGVGAGQMSRVDSARLAVGKAGAERARGAVCASDAFFPFPDGLEVCAVAGVTAFVQPGGSRRDDEVLAAADASGAAMLITGQRHFRH